MAKNNPKNDRPSIGQEVFAVAGLFLAGYLLICLVSYVPDSSAAGLGYTKNWGGRVGSVLAASLLDFLGLSSIWLIILLLFFSFQYLTIKSNTERLPYILAGSTGIIISTSSLLAGFSVERIHIFNRAYPGAGELGNILYRALDSIIGVPGFILFFLFLLLVCLMLAIRFSPYVAGSMVLQLSGKAIDQCKKAVQIKANRKNVKNEQRSEKTTDKEKEREKPVVNIVPSVQPPPVVSLDEDDKNFEPIPVTTGKFKLPGIQLLKLPPKNENVQLDREHYLKVSQLLEEKLVNFGVDGKVVGISPGPVITTYEFAPAPGIKISKIAALENDLALGLKTESVRIVGSVPGKAAVGIEVPNPIRQTVYIREILANEKFSNSSSPLTIGLGKDVVGNVVFATLAEMPHLLIAGATGQGKSVGINTIICSILYKATPDQVRLLMIDPKRIELSGYENIPHLLHPVVVDPKMASRALMWAVLEMERRYQLMEELRVKNLASYNEIAEEKLPLIVIIIDELADLMMVASKDVENSVARLAQMARAAGMHMIMATQRPSVDVLTGLIKANFPTRMSFKVSSKIDSRTILDAGGAEHLLGKGDMLFHAPGSTRLQRIHSAFITEAEIERVVEFLKKQGTASYDDSVLKIAEETGSDEEVSAEDYDEKYDEAVAIVCETGQASISMVQRRLRIGYNRAARMIELMEKEGIVGPADGAKPREVLVRREYS